MFSYIFQDGSYPGVSKLELHPVAGPFEVTARQRPFPTVEVTPIPVQHGNVQVYGYRIGDFAYLTDTNDIPPQSRELLHGVDTLVLDALRQEPPHHGHFTIPQAVETAQEIGARRTVFVHMTHSVLHAEDDAALPEGIELGYDGLVLRNRERGS